MEHKPRNKAKSSRTALTIRAARGLITTALRSPIARAQGFNVREYQVFAAVECFRALRAGRSVTLNLPTGTGKTIISNMVSLLWIHVRPSSRILYVVPRRILVTQHRQQARWLSPTLPAMALAQEHRSSVRSLEAEVLGSQILVSTPKILATMLRTHRIPEAIATTFDLIVVDEFDEFLKFEYGPSRGEARFDVDFERLRRALPSKPPALLMSATSPVEVVAQGNRDVVVKTLAQFVQQQYQPRSIHVPSKAYSRYRPNAHVHVTPVYDDTVCRLDAAVRTEKNVCLDKLCEEAGGAVAEDYVITRLDGILCGRITAIPVRRDGRSIMHRITPAIRGLIGHLRAILNDFDFLFEDMFRGRYAQERRTRRLDRNTLKEHVENLPRLAVKRGENVQEHWPQLRGKWETICQIVTARLKQRGVIFTRFVRLADAIALKLRELGLDPILLHGAIVDDDLGRERALAAFKRRASALLVITRNTGKRGLDLPQADFGIFFSPKAREDTVWQELSRIRSNVQHLKESYMLYYNNTAEERKMQELIAQMQSSGRDYTLSVPRSGYD